MMLVVSWPIQVAVDVPVTATGIARIRRNIRMAQAILYILRIHGYIRSLLRPETVTGELI